jgi:hypothetical protein
MPQPNLDQEPAEGSRETVDRELARQDKKEQGKDAEAKGKSSDAKR